VSYCFVLQATLDCLALCLDYKKFQKLDELNVTDMESAKTQLIYLHDLFLSEKMKFLELECNLESE
jgi:hypothetical protein